MNASASGNSNISPRPGMTRRLKLAFIVIAIVCLIIGTVAYPRWQQAQSYTQIDRLITSRQYESATEVIKSLGPSAKQDPNLLFAQARIARLQGDSNRASTFLQEAKRVGFSPARIEVEETLAMVQSGSVLLGQQGFDFLVQRAPEDIESIRDACAAGYIASRQREAAMHLIDDWMQDRPDQALPHFWKGVVYIQDGAGQANAAEIEFTKALSLNPELLDAKLQWIVALQMQKQYAKVIEVCRDVLAGSPNRLEALVAQASAHAALKQHTEAIEPLKLALAQVPDAYSIRFGLAEQYMAMQNYQQAFEVAKPLAEKWPNDVALNYLLSNALNELSRTQEAESHFNVYQDGQRKLAELSSLEQQVRANPDNVPLLTRLGEGYMQYKWQSAAEWLHRAERANPSDRRLKELLRDYYTAAGNVRLQNLYSQLIPRPSVSE